MGIKEMGTCWKLFGKIFGNLLETCWELFGNLLETCWELVSSSLGTNKILIENISRTYCEHIKNLLGIKNLL
jgi:hypothetical protein